MASKSATAKVTNARGLEQTDQHDGFNDRAGDERARIEIADGRLRGEEREHGDDGGAERGIFRPPREQAEGGGEAQGGDERDRRFCVDGTWGVEEQHVDPNEKRVKRAEELHAHRDQDPVTAGEKLLLVGRAALRLAQANEGFGRKHGGEIRTKRPAVGCIRLLVTRRRPRPANHRRGRRRAR